MYEWKVDGAMEVRDPVCHMTIEKEEAAATSTYEGSTYYFCSQQCKKDFDNDPLRFTGKEPVSEQEEKTHEAAVIDPVGRVHSLVSRSTNHPQKQEAK